MARPSDSPVTAPDKNTTRHKASTNSGWASTTKVCGPRVQGIGQRKNTRMNVKRYSASGTIHNSGIGDRSTDMLVVVPSMRLEGTAASNTQRSRRKFVTVSEGGA